MRISCGYAIISGKKWGGGTLNELFAVYDKPEEIAWESLPDSFVIKSNVGSGCNIIVPDKARLDRARAIQEMRSWKRRKQWLAHAEMQYKGVEKKILIEKYLRGKNGTVPEDYKLYCFNGKVRAILFMMGRFTGSMTDGFFDPQWKYLGAATTHSKDFKEADLPPKPESLAQMIQIAEILTEGFPFVRMDFYDVDGKAVFGEMTFTPAAGFDTFAIDLEGKNMGDYIQLR